MSDDPQLLKPVKAFFDAKFEAHGATYKGLDFGSYERQQLCFDQIMKIWRDPNEAASLNDFGCGYAALVEYLERKNYHVSRYTGFDLSEALVEKAKELYGDRPYCQFVFNQAELKPADYTVASGVFNIKLDAPNGKWLRYILATLDDLWAISQKGMSFNILTIYSDADKMRPDLYYADPTFLFDYCKRNYARNVALLHDYGVYEFTILVRRDNA